jgi:endo-1,4-beta-mannosidase
MKNNELKLNQLKSFAEDKHVKKHKKAVNHKKKFMGLNQLKSFAMDAESASDKYEREQETGDDYVENMKAFNKNMKNKELKLM